MEQLKHIVELANAFKARIAGVLGRLGALRLPVVVWSAQRADLERRADSGAGSCEGGGAAGGGAGGTTGSGGTEAFGGDTAFAALCKGPTAAVVSTMMEQALADAVTAAGLPPVWPCRWR